MKRIGITGGNGFIGSHLINALSLLKDYTIVPFDREFFDDTNKLDQFVLSCDSIVHLAALNRHDDLDLIYATNVGLVEHLIDALKRTKHKAHMIMSSSTQEERNDLYGKSKKEGRKLFSEWSNITGGRFSGLLIPNVYGPFGDPYYNSVVATFCHQITRDEKPEIKVDGLLKLIYVDELVDEIIANIRNEDNSHEINLTHSAEARVSEILDKLTYFKTVYQDKGEIPVITNDFEHKLFNTFRCYMDIPNYFPRKFIQHKDERGAFVEIARLGIGGQTSFSTTATTITRGNHFHTRKIERFAVIKGKALIQLRRIGTDEVLDFYLDGEEPSYVDMPIWYTHNIRNIGEDVLYTIFWINEPYNENDPDTYFEVV